MGTWSTPVPTEIDGRSLVVAAMHQRILGIDVESGKIEWFFPVTSERGDLAYSAPILEGDLCVFTAGFKGPAIAFRMKGTGNIAENQVWRIESNPQSIGTGVAVNGYIYRIGAGPNLIDCVDIKTGDIVWQQRNRAAFWGSISLAGNLAYATDQKGTTLIFRPSPEKFIEVAECVLGDACNSTPALAAGRIYIRAHHKLWCIE